VSHISPHRDANGMKNWGAFAFPEKVQTMQDYLSPLPAGGGGGGGGA
jgi:hypothetical protein